MIVYVNDNYEIKDVGSTTDESLNKVEIADDEYNPFRDWSIAKILCYKVLVKDNRVVMMTPYVDSRIIEHIDKLGKASEENTKSVINAERTLTDMDLAQIETEQILTDMDLRLMEVEGKVNE